MCVTLFLIIFFFGERKISILEGKEKINLKININSMTV